MPCICYGAISGEEAWDEFLKSEKGLEVMKCLFTASNIIKSHRLPIECNDLKAEEFKEMFIKAFTHLLTGCTELKDKQ